MLPALATKGIRVFCVDGDFQKKREGSFPIEGITFPQQDWTYTIREIVPDGNGVWGVRLNEIHNPRIPTVDGDLVEPHFDLRRFELVS